MTSEQSFYKIIEKGDLESLRTIVRSNTDILKNWCYGICFAVNANNLEIIKFLVEYGADVHYNDNYSLREASRSGRLDILMYLVNECNIDPAINNNEVLVAASKNGHIDIVKFLLDHPKVTTIDNYALSEAVSNGNIDIVKLLVEHGADAKSCYDFAMKYAANKGYSKTIKYITSIYNDLIHNDDVVWYAAIGEHFKLVRYLVSIGANASSFDNHVVYLAFLQGDIDTVDFLIHHGARLLIHSENDALIASKFEDKRLLRRIILLGQFHSNIDPHEYIGILDGRHLQYVDPKHEQVIKIIKSRSNKIVNAYADIQIVTV